MPAITLHEEIEALGFDRSYPTLCREIRRLDLRPPCAACRTGSGHASGDIDHEPGDEVQLDWWEIRETPWGAPAYLLVGALLLGPDPSSRHRGDALTVDLAHYAEITGVSR